MSWVDVTVVTVCVSSVCHTRVLTLARRRRQCQGRCRVESVTAATANSARQPINSFLTTWRWFVLSQTFWTTLSADTFNPVYTLQPVWQPVERTAAVRSTGCQTGLTTSQFDNQFDNRLYHVNRAFQLLSMICDCLLLRDVARCPRYVNSSISTTCFAVFIACLSQCQIRWKRHSVAAFVLETVMRGFECVIYTMSQNDVPPSAYYNFDTR